MIDLYARFLHWLNRLTGLVLMTLLSVLVVIVLAAVFWRYVLNDSLTWSAEAARYMCVWIGFLGASVALRRRMHIGLEFFIQRQTPVVRKAVNIASDAAILFFLVFVAVLGFDLAGQQAYQKSPALMISMAWPYLSVPVSASLMACQALYLIACDVTGRPVDGEN